MPVPKWSTRVWVPMYMHTARPTWNSCIGVCLCVCVPATLQLILAGFASATQSLAGRVSNATAVVVTPVTVWQSLQFLLVFRLSRLVRGCACGTTCCDSACFAYHPWHALGYYLRSCRRWSKSSLVARPGLCRNRDLWNYRP